MQRRGEGNKAKEHTTTDCIVEKVVCCNSMPYLVIINYKYYSGGLIFITMIKCCYIIQCNFCWNHPWQRGTIHLGDCLQRCITMDGPGGTGPSWTLHVVKTGTQATTLINQSPM